jgi:signal recognition particle subunit SRP54
MASRILGMGDMLSLIERAEETVNRDQAEQMGRRLMKGDFDLEDFLTQLREVKKLGPLSQILEMLPGFARVSKEITPDVTDRQMKTLEAIISSMTREERRNPQVINGSRKRRIARGSGTDVQDVNELLSQFRQMQRMMKQVSRSGRGRGGGLEGLMGMFR